MAREEEKNPKSDEETLDRLKKQVDGIIGEFQSDVNGIRGMCGSKHLFEGACDDVFDEVEKVFVGTVRQGRELAQGEEAYEAIGEIAWAVVTFLEETACQRVQLEALVRDKCEELVKGNAYMRWRKKQRTKMPARVDSRPPV